MISLNKILQNKSNLEFLIKSQEEQKDKGNLTEMGIEYLNGMKQAYKYIFNKTLLATPKSNKEKFLSLVSETDKDFSKNVEKKFDLNKAINIHMGNQIEEFHAKDWPELNQNLKEKFGTGSFRFFNNKRVNHRMIKIFSKDGILNIFKYLNDNYPEFKPEYNNLFNPKNPYERMIPTFITIKCPL